MDGTGAPVDGGLGHRPALDGLRGVAVALVVLVHSGTSLWPSARGWLARGGPLGVHLFFVLSGFLITTVLLGEQRRVGRIDLRRFGRRRARRLVPALVPVLLALALVPMERPPLRSLLGSAATVLSFTGNWVMKGGDNPVGTFADGRITMAPEVLHTWSLAIEAHFYVLWGLALWAMARRAWPLRRMAVVTGIAVLAVAVGRAAAHQAGTHWLTLYLSTSTRLDAPLVGALVGLAFHAGSIGRVPPRVATVVGTTALALFVAAAFTIEWSEPALDRGLYTVLAGAAGLAILGPIRAPISSLGRALSVAPLVWLGRVSYSLYLWHYVVFSKIERAEPWPPGPTRFVLGVTLSLALAGLSYRLVEVPFHRRRAHPAPSLAAAS